MGTEASTGQDDRADERTGVAMGATTVETARGAIPTQAHSWVRRLADEREIHGPLRAPALFWDVAHAWYLQGFLDVPEEAT